MTVERYKGDAPLERPEDLGRLVALGGFVVAAPLLADPVGILRGTIEDAYTFYIETGMERWANGDEITDKERADISAGNLLLQLPDILIYRQSQRDLAQQTIEKNEDNPWLGPTLATLERVGLIEPETNRVPPDFRQFGALLDAIMQSCQAQKRGDRQPLRTAFQWAPHEAMFRKALRQTFREIISVASEVQDDMQPEAELSDEWRHTDSPVTRRSSEEQSYIVWSNWSQTSIYGALHQTNGGQYLNRLLLDIEKVSEKLSSC
ncbi:MAG TPA: hypothetical protein VHD60_04525 [Candidatus Saccharimonadales bacterium]|nr:hypothetical protein [Candidatus Saccharimonadales bacterium]